jgi:hypothetical protein
MTRCVKNPLPSAGEGLGAFRAHGLFVTAGDLPAAEGGLTAARWQVLGAVALAVDPPPIVEIGSDLVLRDSPRTPVAWLPVAEAQHVVAAT